MVETVITGATETAGSELMRQFASVIQVFNIKALGDLLQKLEIVTEFESTTYADILKVESKRGALNGDNKVFSTTPFLRKVPWL